MMNQVLEPQLHRKAQREPAAETCRMFESDLLERFSRIHPATPFVVWLPIAGLFIARSAWLAPRPSAPPGIAGMFLAGMVVWSFAEYVLHRWALPLDE